MLIPNKNPICWDCKKEIKDIKIDEENQKITGAKFYNQEEKWWAKCDKCFAKDSVLRNFQESEVFTRCVGYLRPVQQFNPGKKEEVKERKMFKK